VALTSRRCGRRAIDRQDAARGIWNSNSSRAIYEILNGPATNFDAYGRGEVAFGCMRRGKRLVTRGDPVSTSRVKTRDPEACCSWRASPSVPPFLSRAVYVRRHFSITPEDLEWADELGYRVKLLGLAFRTDKGSSSACIQMAAEGNARCAQVGALA